MLASRISAAVICCLSLGLSNPCFAEKQPQKLTEPVLPPVLLKMSRDAAVHQELGLSESQIGQIMSALRQVDGDWFRSRDQYMHVQVPIVKQLTQKLDAELTKILSEDQRDRLRQLERQALGVRMVQRPDVQRGLELTSDQSQRFREAFMETDQLDIEVTKKVRENKIDSKEAVKQLAERKSAERESVVGALTENQKTKLAGLTGDPFDFSQVKITDPQAPEITLEGSTWLQGGPQKLSQLKGKVVAVHFYVHNCINCIRNLPHYKAWHEDYADDGLVIIGIQTPEYGSGRDPKKVMAAAREKGIEYPILLDLEEANWKRWAQSWWPTVYLIDKQGFVRKWRYGELNWQGYEGEKEFRKAIETLLAES